MDQRPGQNVDLGLYFHMEGPVSPKIKLKNQKMTEKKNKKSKRIFESSTEVLTKIAWNDCDRICKVKLDCPSPSEGAC